MTGITPDTSPAVKKKKKITKKQVNLLLSKRFWLVGPGSSTFFQKKNIIISIVSIISIINIIIIIIFFLSITSIQFEFAL